MVQKIWQDILNGTEVRQNLSKLRKAIKEKKAWEAARGLAKEQELFLEELLKNADAKTRKNAALLIGDLKLSALQMPLWRAYEKEETLFVKSSYLTAMQQFDMSAFLKPLKERARKLAGEELADETNRKHIREEKQQLNKLILSIEGMQTHVFTGWQKENEVIFIANRHHLEAVLEEMRENADIPANEVRVMNAGIRMKVRDLKPFMQIRTWQEVLFLVKGMKTCEKDPLQAAKVIADSELLKFLEERHKEKAPFYFRVEMKMKSPTGREGEKEIRYLEEKQRFVKSFAEELEVKMGQKLINSPGNYEVEFRLVENKEGRFNIMVKLFTLPDERFSYRKEVVPSSIKPVNAALLVRLSEEYMEEGARVLDPFCGVGTMLIERQKKVKADTLYGVDIHEDAIEKARRNTEKAGQIIHYINRDVFTFRHEYLFDEIFTNMPFAQGRKTPPEIYEVYRRFFENAGKLVKKNGIVALYTHDRAYVDKLYEKAGMELLKKCRINVREDTWLYIFRWLG